MKTIAFNYLSEDEQQFIAQAHSILQEWIDDNSVLSCNVILLDILSRWKLPANYIVVALLLPIIREEFFLPESVVNCFDNQIIKMVQLAHELTFSQYLEDEIIESQSLRNFFINAYIDHKIVLLCIADHLASAAILSDFDDDTHKIWLQKTFRTYLCLLDMFGMWAYRQDVGNLGLALRDIDMYDKLQRSIISYHKRYDELFEYIHNSLSVHPVSKELSPDIQLHFTSAIGVYLQVEKARRRGEKFDLHEKDTIRVDIFVENVSDCYVMLGVLHNLWLPTYHRTDLNNMRFHDYIARPRYNGYRSLITTILCDVTGVQHLVEFRIMTREMGFINSQGIVAVTGVIKNTWWNIPNLERAIQAKEPDELVVFTPQGEAVYPVKKGSTVVDLAFRIHSGLGPYARQFWVNGRQVSEEYVLRHCDLIEIVYDKQYPSIQTTWLEHVKTTRAKNAIKRFLKKLEYSPHKGRQLIDKVLERESHIYRMRLPAAQVEAALIKAARRHGCPTLETLYVKVLEGNISPDEIVSSIIEDELVNYIIPENGQKFPVDRIRIARTWMQEKGTQKLNRNLRIMPGVDIVGRLKGKSKHTTLVVYRKDDPLIRGWKKFIPLRWRSGSNAIREYVEITITASPRLGITESILNSVFMLSQGEEHGLIVHRIHAENEDNMTSINLTVDAPSFDRIHDLQDLLTSLQKQGSIINFNIWQLFPGQKMKIAGRLDKRQQNPYTLKQIRDQGMFFGREDEMTQVIQQINEGQNFIVLYGQKRIGKTSLLHQLTEYFLPTACNVLAIPFDAHSISPFDAVQFVLGLVDATLHRLDLKDRHSLRLKKEDVLKDPFKAFSDWVIKVEQRVQGTKLFFIIDEFTRAEEECERGRLDSSFFDGIQWLAGTQHIGLLLCVHDNIYRHTSQSWGMMQRAYPVRLDTLDEPAAIRLIQQPLERIYEFEHGLVERIVKLTNCHPYFIHAICLELTSLMSQQERDRVSASDLDSAMNRVLRTGDHYFSHFRNAVDDYSWATVKIIAYTGNSDDDWVNRDDIHNAMVTQDGLTNRWQISDAISQLYRAGIIEARQSQGAITYRIPVELFQFWLRQQTHPLISKDMQRKD